MNNRPFLTSARFFRFALFASLTVLLTTAAWAQPGRGGPRRGGGGDDNGGRRGPSPERIFEWMDRNRDGKLDESEVARMPGSFRERLQKNGLDFKQGASKDQFISVAGKAMEEARKEREENGDDRRRGDDRRDGRDDDRRRDDRRDGDRSSSSSKSFAKELPKIQLTFELPESHAEADTDLDGQIGMYEWREWKPDALEEFLSVDTNADGFLTPAEILIAEANKNGKSFKRVEMPKVIVLGSAPKKKSNSSSRSSSSSSSSRRDERGRDENVDFREQDRRNEKKSREYFGYMDKNKDGRLDQEEWNASRRLRPWFEREGIRFRGSMTADEFSRHYVKLTGAR